MREGLTLTADRLRTPHRYETLDSLRGVCACMVALFHFHTNGFISNASIVRNGPLFVDFFFVLSGFVISSSYGRKLASGFSVTTFIGLRLGRIYPLHLFVICLFFMFELAFALAGTSPTSRAPFEGVTSFASLVYNLLLVQIFVGPSGSWNQVSWSIAAEFWTYIIFAVLWRSAPRLLKPACVFLAGSGMLTLAVATDHYITVFNAWAIVRCLVGFSLGVIAFHLVSSRSMDGREKGGALAEIGTAVVVPTFVWWARGPWTLAAPPLFMLVVILFATSSGPVSRLLQSRLLLLLGTLSYSIYMTHYFLQLRLVNILTLMQRVSHERWTFVQTADAHTWVGGSRLFGDVMSIIMLFVVGAASALTYRFVERRGQEWSRRKLLGSRPLATEQNAEAKADTAAF